MCIVFATLVWFGYALNTQRTATIAVPIEFTGIPGDVAVDTPLPREISIVISDAGIRLSRYKQFEPIQFDLSGQIKGESGKVQVSIDMLRQRIDDYLLGTTTLESIWPEGVQSSYHHQHAKLVPVVFDGQLTPAAQYQLDGDVHLSPNMIHVYGSSEMLRKIDTIYTMPTQLDDLRDSVDMQIDVIVPNGVRVEVKRVRLQAALELYTEKTMVVPLNAVCERPDLRLVLFISDVTITARVGINHFDDVCPDNVYAYCEWDDEDNGMHQLPVQLSVRSEYISSVRVSPAWVDYEIEDL